MTYVLCKYIYPSTYTVGFPHVELPWTEHDSWNWQLGVYLFPLYSKVAYAFKGPEYIITITLKGFNSVCERGNGPA